MSAPLLTSHPHGITTVDTGYGKPGIVASHLLVHGGRAAFIDVGANSSLPHLLGALEVLGIPRAAVDYVILTHAHLDHAGGAGALMRELPAARAVLHPRAAPHLIEPEKLIAGTRAVYGEAVYRRMYGELVPIPAERVLLTADGQRLGLAGRPLEFLHTPGHALHHHVIVDEQSAGVFSGDTFGVSYRELDTERGSFIVPTTTPTQFDPEQLVGSIDRILERRPQSIYLTHYGRITEVERLGTELKAQVRELAALARHHAQAPDRHAAINAAMRALWRERLIAHGCTLGDTQFEALLGMDAELNSQGLVVWLDRQGK